jgi:hypothetical protein
MLSIYTYGYGYSQRRCKDAVRWFCSQYLRRHKIVIEVLHRGLRRELVLGYCSVIDCNWKPRVFLIEIQSGLNESDYLITLFHELHHCFQHIKGDLRDKKGIRCWKGIDCSEVDYTNQPWEIEANQREQELYEEYIRFLGA